MKDILEKHLFALFPSMLKVDSCTLVTELRGHRQTIAMKYNKDITRFNDDLKLQQKNILLLKNSADVWQRKFIVKDTELITAQQDLNDSNVRCQELQGQIKILSARILKEEHKNKTLNDSYSNLEITLKKERARFDRDDRCLKENIEDLKRANQWLREKLAESSMPMTPKHGRDLRVSMRLHTEADSDVQQSNETQLKGIYPENAVCQPQMISPKQKPKKPNDYKTQERHHTSPELECTKVATQHTIPQDVKECSYCYRKASEFNSQKEFMDHIGRCE